uniref:CSON000984 protein n=1 Tax=Culicoides sonorensis TaxID=179676 RepID=A0A336LQG2_CULSO
MAVYINALIEGLEVILHSILYVRKLYPDEIFRKRKIYGIPIYVSIYPALNDYLVMVLKTAKHLISEKKLERLEIVFYRSAELQEIRFESYCIEFDFFKNCDRNFNDVHLYEFEDAMRKSLLHIEERIRGVSRLPSNAKFKVLLHTTRQAYMNLNEKPELTNFMWFRDDVKTEEGSEKKITEQKKILPLTSIEKIGIQMYMERTVH